MKQPPTQGRGGGGVLGQRAFAWFLAAAIVALALLCLFYGTAFAPILRGGRDSFHLGFRARTLTGALPADLALPSIPVPIRWPRSRDEVWQANIPHPHLAADKSDQRRMVVNGDNIHFPCGGTHFHTGADKYIAHIAQESQQPLVSWAQGGCHIRAAHSRCHIALVVGLTGCRGMGSCCWKWTGF